MKQIALSKNNFQALSNLIQNYNKGFTIDGIRSLDKVLTTINLELKDFNDKLAKFDPKKDAKEMDKFFEKDGFEVVTISLEDADYDFIKLIWSQMNSFSGANDKVRKIVLDIDTAIKSPSVPVI